MQALHWIHPIHWDFLPCYVSQTLEVHTSAPQLFQRKAEICCGAGMKELTLQDTQSFRACCKGREKSHTCFEWGSWSAGVWAHSWAERWQRIFPPCWHGTSFQIILCCGTQAWQAEPFIKGYRCCFKDKWLWEAGLSFAVSIYLVLLYKMLLLSMGCIFEAKCKNSILLKWVPVWYSLSDCEVLFTGDIAQKRFMKCGRATSRP